MTERDQNETAALERIERELSPQTGLGPVGRRAFFGTAAAVATVATPAVANAAKSYAAIPPEGFTPFSAPGRIVKVTKKDSLQTNQRYPKPEAAKEMLEKALTELTGKKDLVSAVQQFVHKDDIVCVKVNGIAKQNMGTNKELVLPFLEALIAAGVLAKNITVLEQYGDFLNGTRVNASNVPAGVKVATHRNEDATMAERMIPGTGTNTKFVKYLTEATAAFNFSLIKDHSICGYTGALKNMTHGCSTNPHDFHVHHASPQIALMYAQDVIKSRVRLCITDAFKVMADGGPLWKRPEMVKPHESIYVTTDPVAMDTVGWELVDKLRSELKLKSLADAGRLPAYIKAAADLGLGVHERSQIQVKEIAV